MSDIFSIKSVNVALKIKDKEYPFSDPSFPAKVQLRKEMSEISAKKEEIDPSEYSLKMYDLNKKMVMMHLPGLSSEILDELGEFAFNALVTKLLELTATNFGAVVEKIESQEKK